MWATRKIQTILLITGVLLATALFPSTDARADGATLQSSNNIESLNCYAGHVTVAHPNGGFIKYDCNTSLHQVCAGGQVCLYKDNNFFGGVARFVGNDSSYGDNSFNVCSNSCGLGDNASSARNNGNTCAVTVYEHSNYKGSSTKYPLGTQTSIMGNYAIGNDRASSHLWCT